MRLLHVTPFYEPAWAYGGMARAAAGLCRALARRGHEVTVATALLDGAHAIEEGRDGVRIERFPGPGPLRRRLVPWAPGLRGFLAAELPATDLVHVHGHRNGFAVTAHRAAQATGTPSVLQPHGTYPHHGQHRLAKLLFDRLVGDRIVEECRALLAVSEAEAADLPRRARVVFNGVEAPGSATRATAPEPWLLFVGSDRPQKRGHVLPELLRSLPEMRLKLVGRFGSAFPRLFAPLSGRVAFSGVLEGQALADAYASAGLVVHPAVGEAFGLVPFEAALLGTPAVVAGGHGCGEWLARAGGCVVPPDDPAALAEAVRARLADRGRGEAEARAVAEFARRELTWDRAAQAVESVYEDVLGRRRGAA